MIKDLYKPILSDIRPPKKAPINVLIVGTSPQIKYPKIIAKTKAKYFKGVTRETSDYL